jgi:hypothetical protein
VAPSLIQDELVRSQDPFDGVDQSVPIHEPVYLGTQQPALLCPHADLVSPAVEMLSSKKHVDEALR